MLLVLDPNERMSVEGAIAHPWFNSNTTDVGSVSPSSPARRVPFMRRTSTSSPDKLRVPLAVTTPGNNNTMAAPASSPLKRKRGDCEDQVEPPQATASSPVSPRHIFTPPQAPHRPVSKVSCNSPLFERQDSSSSSSSSLSLSPSLSPSPSLSLSSSSPSPSPPFSLGLERATATLLGAPRLDPKTGKEVVEEPATKKRKTVRVSGLRRNASSSAGALHKQGGSGNSKKMMRSPDVQTRESCRTLYSQACAGPVGE